MDLNIPNDSKNLRNIIGILEKVMKQIWEFENFENGGKDVGSSTKYKNI